MPHPDSRVQLPVKRGFAVKMPRRGSLTVNQTCTKTSQEFKVMAINTWLTQSANTSEVYGKGGSHE